VAATPDLARPGCVIVAPPAGPFSLHVTATMDIRPAGARR
jgi:hypothetical protein